MGIGLYIWDLVSCGDGVHVCMGVVCAKKICIKERE
jgi:hypothetical protein